MFLGCKPATLTELVHTTLGTVSSRYVSLLAGSLALGVLLQ